MQFFSINLFFYFFGDFFFKKNYFGSFSASNASDLEVMLSFILHFSSFRLIFLLFKEVK